jgi:hypothetical protein
MAKGKSSMKWLFFLGALLVLGGVSVAAFSTHTGYEKVDLAFNEERQASTNRPVLVVVHGSIEVSKVYAENPPLQLPVYLSEYGRIVAEIHPTQTAPVEQIAGFSVGGNELGALELSQTGTLSFIVPAGYWYRVVPQSISGEPTFLIFSVYEIPL